MSWIAQFRGGPLEGKLMQVDSRYVDHMVTSYSSDKIRTYRYVRQYPHLKAEDTWIYTVEEITEQSKFRE